ncbi:MAG: hypothetical protein ACI4JN_07560, partial [Ruminococcus sp.]
YTVDLTALSDMNAVCWSENRQVTDNAELEKLSKICQESTSAEIQVWWSLDLNWGDRPDSSVTAGKSEDEVSELKAAAAKECIAVINVRPMNLPLDTNMGCGPWNSGQTSDEYTLEDISDFQSFLVNKKSLDLNEKNYDLNNDGVLNVFDLSIMKYQYEIKQNEGRPVIEGEKGLVSIKDNKITFEHGIGSEMILEIEHKDCVGGGGCISFVETIDDNEYWVAYEWQTNETGVVKIDMTTPNQVTLNDVKVEESQNPELYKKLGELCMQEKEANLFYWWAAQSWGNNYPDGTDLTKYLTVRSAHITSPLT